MQPLEKKAIFVPAVSGIRNTVWNRDYLYKDHDARFFGPKSYFQYNLPLLVHFMK